MKRVEKSQQGKNLQPSVGLKPLLKTVKLFASIHLSHRPLYLWFRLIKTNTYTWKGKILEMRTTQQKSISYKCVGLVYTRI